MKTNAAPETLAPVTYTTRGSVRGACGHAHRTIGAAQSCRERDEKGCRAQGGYSDRAVIRVDGEPLTDAELATLALAQDLAHA